MEKTLSEDYCSYEVAKLLKEKGFDELTTFVWYQHLPTSLDCQNLANKKARDYFYHDETTEHNSSYKNSRHKPEYIHGDIFSCPTHQMAMKWLREVYDIHISVGKTFLINDIDNKPYLVYVCTKKCHTSYNSWQEYHSTYEDAVEAALKYCLTYMISDYDTTR